MKKTALEIVKKLKNAGHEVYWVGGCVRDIVMGKTPHDFDIVTSAKPDEVEKLFSKTVAVGKKFGVILVIKNKHQFEVATFRTEADYRDSRRPSQVSWATAEEDVKRRDFTVNALLYDPLSNKVIDWVDGQKDIKNKILRFIGNPEKRIGEDHLRILRAVRFKNALGFKFDPETEKALRKNAKLVISVSAERIRDELNKMLKNPSRTKSIEDLSKLEILNHLLPELENGKGSTQPKNFHAEGDVWIHTILSLKKIPAQAKLSVIWAVLLHDIGKPQTWKIREHPKYGKRITFYGHVKLSAQMTEKIMKRLKFPRKFSEKVVFLVREHLRHKDIMQMKLAKQIRWARHPWIHDLLAVWKADGQGSMPEDLTLYNYSLKLYQAELKKPQPPIPLLNGNQIMKILKIESGPEVGKIMEALMDAQLEEKVKTKVEAEKFIKNI